jgi:hypothetical protein
MRILLYITTFMMILYLAGGQEYPVAFGLRSRIQSCQCDSSWMKWSICSREKGFIVSPQTNYSIKIFVFKEDPNLVTMTGGTSLYFKVKEIANNTRPNMHVNTYRSLGFDDLWDIMDISMICCDGLDVENDTFPGYCEHKGMTSTPRMCSKLPQDIQGPFLHINTHWIPESEQRLTVYNSISHYIYILTIIYNIQRIPIMLPPGAVEATDGYFDDSGYYIMISPHGSKDRKIGEVLFFINWVNLYWI